MAIYYNDKQDLLNHGGIALIVENGTLLTDKIDVNK